MVVRFGALLLAGLLFLGKQTASVTLVWDPPRDNGIVGYRLYYTDITNERSQKAESLKVGRTTRWVVPKLIVGHTYSFFVTAINAAGRESLPSNVVKYVVRLKN